MLNSFLKYEIINTYGIIYILYNIRIQSFPIACKKSSLILVELIKIISSLYSVRFSGFIRLAFLFKINISSHNCDSGANISSSPVQRY